MLGTILSNARKANDSVPKPGQPGYLSQESVDAVNRWRHLVHMVSIYANGAAVRGVHAGWDQFWSDTMDREAFVKLVARRSRITRALSGDGNMDAPLYDDSVQCWEYDLAVATVRDDQYADRARRNGNQDATRQMMLETEIDLVLIRAYTGAEITPIRDALAASKGKDPKYPGHAVDGSRIWEPHPLLDLIVNNRPVV